MKNAIFVTTFSLSLISSTAFAHTSRSEVCKSMTHDLVYTGNNMFGGLYKISLKNKDQDISALPTMEVEVKDEANTLEDADVLLDTIKYKAITKKKSRNDCWYEHEEWKSIQKIKINAITSEASSVLGLKKGDQITFICKESIDYPSRSDSSKCKEEY